MEKQILKLAAPFLKKCSKSALPVLENICVINNTARLSNLDVELIFNIEKPDGLYTLVNGEMFLQPEETNEFPEPLLKDTEPTKQEITIGPNTTPSTTDIVNIAACRANDEMRPTMCGVHFTQNRIEASDAHVLKTINVNKNTNASGKPNFVSPMPQLLLSALNNTTDQVNISIHKNQNEGYQKSKNKGYQFRGKIIKYQFSNFTIAMWETEGNYPIVDSVLPNTIEYNHFMAFSHTQAAEYIKFGKALKHESKLMRFVGNTLSMQNPETGVSKTFPEIETVPQPDRQYDAIIMPMMADPEPTDPDKTIFGISYEKLAKAIKGFKGKIVLGINIPSKALLVYLIPAKQKTCKLTTSRKASNPKPETRNPEPETRNPKPETRNSEPETRNSKLKVIWQAA